METFNLTLSPSSSHANKTNIFQDGPFKPVEFVLIVLGLSILSLITIIGNVLVMLSIKVNRNLQTVNNYFLFSLACADLFIGVFSMNLYTVYIVTGHWPLGALVCDLWLALDYVVSNASVMNLLIISFDRYFCVTKPLSYPVKRTHKMAGMMIAAAWILSFILWAPAILFWQFITGSRTVPEGECYIQFFSNAVVTFGTAIAAFYLPVITMTILYWQISKASRSRVRRRDNRRVSRVSNDGGQAGLGNERNMDRKSTQEGEEMVSRKQSASDTTTGLKISLFPPAGEERDSENDSISGSVLASSNQRDDEAVSISTNGDIRARQNQSASLATESWVRFTCFKTASQKDLQNTYKVNSESQGMTNGKERLSLVSQKIISPHSQKRKSSSSREKKVTRTIMAILVAFATTWTPYNVMVLINTFCSDCIPNTVWIFGYWLCYINSTVNPACYALCNVTFKNTFKQLLTCKYRNIHATRKQ
nr:muscarinic acetylcholine receptor M2-like [Danio rerio]XP_021330246.1 muscarinic acetylcholine receptor M2-like [Danio rerio]|eukprot:XP_021326218.1 muscarinic acetylcholine receptor M2-like [Danio rerio]